jgi:DNA-binding MarR family transcriptional regulator/GNAT superfamily N-acetyltransferase
MSERAGDAVAAVRAFNRLYTNKIGVLRGGYLDSPYSLTEARLLFELAQQDATEVAELRRTLDIDAGYLSRVLARFDADKVITRERSETDARRQVIRLADAGRDAIRELDAHSADHIGRLLAGLSAAEVQRVLEAMATITDVLTDSPPTSPAPLSRAYLLRPPRTGEMGWVVQRQAAVYAAEYGWDETYESLVARIVADYVDNRDPSGEACWIAEVDGEPAGSVFCVRKDATTAQLRLLFVEPSARGLGIGSRLVEECMRFARDRGYQRMMLWTNDVLAAARRIYQRAGFALNEESKHHSFGRDLVGQNWSRPL